MKILNWILFLEKLVGEKPISNIGSYIGGMNLSIEDFDKFYISNDKKEFKK